MNYSYLNPRREEGPRHWHITSAPKPPGECAACDAEYRSLISVTPPAEAVTDSDRPVTDDFRDRSLEKPRKSGKKRGK